MPAKRTKDPLHKVPCDKRLARGNTGATVILLALFAAAQASAQITISEGTNISVDVAKDGRMVTDILGGIWTIPAGGGKATPITDNPLPAARPHFSPTGNEVVYQATTTAGQQLMIYDFKAHQARALTDGSYFDQQPDWHPDGRLVLFSSARNDSGFDLWEIDVPTGALFRLSTTPGDELEPAYSADGRSIAFIRHMSADQNAAATESWALVVREYGKPERTLLTSVSRLAAPSWRSDGGLITYLSQGRDGLEIDMLILSDPPLSRQLATDRDIFAVPVCWLDRENFLYTANGHIRERNINTFAAKTVPFHASLRDQPRDNVRDANAMRTLPTSDEPAGKRVIRAARLYDGVSGGYRHNMDVVIDGGHISAVVPRTDHPDAIIIDMGDLTMLPGYVDAYAKFPADTDVSLGAVLLSYGLTTVVANDSRAIALNSAWSSEKTPGPRVLQAQSIDTAKIPAKTTATTQAKTKATAATSDSSDTNTAPPWLVTVSGDLVSGLQHRNAVRQWQNQGVPVLATSWQAGFGADATLLLGRQSLPVSPGGNHYEDVTLALGGDSITLFSGLADAATPGLDELLHSRQADLLGPAAPATQHLDLPPEPGAALASIVAASEPDGLPPGIALHAELRALAAAGASGEQALRAAGANAAAALNLGLQIGRVATGARADLVIVDGDPLASVSDAAKVVAVVRNGRFYSAIGLIERAKAEQAASANVE